MSIELQVVNGPSFEWGDQIIVKYVGDLIVNAVVQGSVDMLGSVAEFSAPIVFNATYEQPSGVVGYTFTQDLSDGAEWVGDVNG